MMTSSAVIMPRSPWLASPGWTKNAGVPVDANVAAILRPIWPDLPIPVTMIRPRAPRISATAASTLGAAADVALELPHAREACPHNLAPTTSSLMQLALGDALAIALLETRGFTALDYQILHPGGKLGAMLRFVRDIMHDREAMPLVCLGTPMSAAIVEMSAKSFGCVAIADRDDRLVGIITDGDLRRHMRADLLDARVEDIMTRSPKTVRPDQIASEVLELLNASKISAALVVEAGKPIGIVHLHDLLRIGVA